MCSLCVIATHLIESTSITHILCKATNTNIFLSQIIKVKETAHCGLYNIYSGYT